MSPARGARSGAAVLLRLAGMLVPALLLALVSSAPALAHAGLVDSDPAPGAVLPEAPHELVLGFSEQVTVAEGSVLFTPDGVGHAVEARADGPTVAFTLPHLPDPGSHALSWRVVSADGHTLTGSLPFAVGRETALDLPETAPDPGPDALLLAAQGATYLGLLGATGVAVLGLAVPAGAARRRVRRGVLALAGTGLLGLGAGCWRVLADRGTLTGAELAAALAGALGLAALGLAGSGRAALGVGPVRTSGPWRPVVVGLGAALALGSLPAVGHTRSAEPFLLVVAADLVHVAVGALWCGGLLTLVLALPLLERAEAGRLASRVSAVALVGLLPLAATGLLLGQRILGSWAALLHTAHGRVLLVKVGVVLLAVGLGGWHRRRLRHRGAADRRTLVLEGGLLALVLLVTGILSHASPVPEAGQRALSVTREVAGVRVQVSVEGGRVGPNQVVVRVVDETGAWVPVAEPPELSVRRGRVTLGGPMRSLVDEHRLTILVPEAGEWELRVSLTLSRYDAPVVTTGLPIVG